MIKPKVRDNCVHLSENSHEKYGKSGNRNSNRKLKCSWCESKRHNVMNCPYVKKKDRSMFKCTYCPGAWHTEKNCFKKIKDKKNKEEIEKIAVEIH